MILLEKYKEYYESEEEDNNGKNRVDVSDNAR